MRVTSACAGTVVCYSCDEPFSSGSHECMTRLLAAQKLAALKGYAFSGVYDPARRYGGSIYFVPNRTLVGNDHATFMGIASADDLFGGVVPHAFVGTKTITHPLIDGAAYAPAAWSAEFPEAVRDAVLHGYSAFCREDALRAGAKLLERGAVRVKPALALGGRGQSVVESGNDLERALDDIDSREIAECGVVLEENLSDVATFSVGQVRVADLVATYFGTQSLTSDNAGVEVYGGSDLVVARGDFDALLALDLQAEVRGAVERARQYDAAAHTCFPGFFASRRNYDVVRGRDCDGADRWGVLEQSWRIGGASGAEIAALERFRGDAGACVVRARCVEVYGESEAPAPAAVTYFRGVDDKVGFITKYTTVEAHADD